ncbi:hypothetical protein DFH08DRAFT_826789 [Mycena albidolilacea]|uniref:Uncharacterized protein n=1 Tax=Mycena albidolilacea TaxID=1033008 RepID=A0AAD6YZJ1_9AGAR|nr:hypothetical protein DFH08DRAFT_826789 [Mycena albidolilacea]
MWRFFDSQPVPIGENDGVGPFGNVTGCGCAGGGVDEGQFGGVQPVLGHQTVRNTATGVKITPVFGLRDSMTRAFQSASGVHRGQCSTGQRNVGHVRHASTAEGRLGQGYRVYPRVWAAGTRGYGYGLPVLNPRPFRVPDP